MSTHALPRLTPEQYLELERKADRKSEYLYGETLAMAGGSPLHSLVIANLHTAIGSRLRGKPCYLFNADLRICVNWGDLFAYPDLTAVCGPLQYRDDRKDTLVNPALLVEVLSPSTKNFDRSEKLRLYRMIPSLQEVLLVDPTPVEIEHWRKLPNGNWELATIRDRASGIHLESVDVHLPVSEVYENAELALT